MKQTFKTFLTEMAVPQMYRTLDDETIRDIIENGTWNGHGSEVSEWVDDILDDKSSPYHSRMQDVIDPDRWKDSVRSPEFFAIVKDWLNKRRLPYVCRNIEDELTHTAHRGGNQFELYRAMKVPQSLVEEMVSGKSVPLGKFWSTGMVDAYQGYGDVEITLVGLVNANAIDWKQTLLSRIDYRYGDDETEIQLIEGAKVTLVRIEDEHGEVLGEPNSECTV